MSEWVAFHIQMQLFILGLTSKSLSQYTQVLGVTDTAVRSFVQQNDPIPRVLMTSDPAYHALVCGALCVAFFFLHCWLLCLLLL